MTAEHIHDALTLLPSDLVAETDHKRTAIPKKISWVRYAALAACLALVVFTGSIWASNFYAKSAQDSAAEAPMMQAAPESGLEEQAAAEAAPAAPDIADDAPAEALGGATTGFTAFQLPVLTIICGDTTLDLPHCGMSWDIPQEDGTTRTLDLDSNIAIESLETDTDTLELHWTREPDQLSAWLPDESTGTPGLTCTTTSISLLPGSHTYYFTAHWEEGSLRYMLHVTRPEA